MRAGLVGHGGLGREVVLAALRVAQHRTGIGRLAVAGAPALGACAQHGFPLRGDLPSVLCPQADQFGVAVERLVARARAAAGPIRGGVFNAAQLVAVTLQAKVHDVRALHSIGPPGALGGQRGPTRAFAVDDAAGAAVQCCGQRHGGGAQRVLVVVVMAGGNLPVEHAFGVALDREAVHEVCELFVGHVEVGRHEHERAAVDVDVAAVNGIAPRTAQVAGGPPFRLVVPPTEGVGRAHRGRKVVGKLGLDVVLLRAVLRGGAQQVPVLVAAVVARNRARHRRARTAGCTGGDKARWEGQRLAFAVGLAEVEKPRPVTILVAHRGARLLAAVGGAGAIQVERLVLHTDFAVRLELRRHACDVVDHRAYRIAGVGGRERAVENVDPLDLFGRDQHPARRVGGAVAQVVAQQNAVGKHHGPRWVASARGARGQHGVVVVTDVALAHQQTGQVLERVLAVGGVDRVLDLLARHAFDSGGDLRRQRCGLATGDGDDAQLFDRHAVGRLRQHGRGPGEGQGEGAGHGQRHAAFAHGNS